MIRSHIVCTELMTPLRFVQSPLLPPLPPPPPPSLLVSSESSSVMWCGLNVQASHLLS